MTNPTESQKRVLIAEALGWTECRVAKPGFWECPYCHAKYALAQNIKLIPLDEKQADYVTNEHNGFKTSPTDEEEEANRAGLSVQLQADEPALTELYRGISEQTRKFIERDIIPHRYNWNPKTGGFDVV